MSQQRRYPGAKPFAENQANVFYGRDQASSNLHRLIKQEELVVLHAKSGVGKSSLIKAGLLPQIRTTSSFTPLEIRLGAAGSGGALAPILTTRRLIDQQLRTKQETAFLDKLLPDDPSLWRSLKQLQIQQESNLEVASEAPGFLLIFDQFEELFTYNRSEQLDFRRQLAEALYTALPQRYWDILSLYDAKNSPLTLQDRQRLQTPLRVHVLMAIREDRIHLLGSLADYLPMISNHWFELEHLTEKEAKQAIIAPANSSGDFATLPFTFTPEACDSIIQYLSKGIDGIESTQLQVICDAVDRKIAYKSERKVSPAILGDLENITANYYWEKLEDITDLDQRTAARRLIEDDLIFEDAERRLSLFGGQINQMGIYPETLKILVDGYLLRAEPDLRGGYNYELSHDSLVKPILEAKRDRVETEKAAERANLAKEQAAKLAAAQEKSRKARRLNTILFSLLGLAIMAICTSVYFIYDANTARQEAEDSLVKYELEKQEREAAQLLAKRQRGIQQLEDANIFLLSGDTLLAQLKLDSTQVLALPELATQIEALQNRIKPQQ